MTLNGLNARRRRGLGFVTIIDMGIVGMRDLENLPYAFGAKVDVWRRAAQVGDGMVVGIGDRVDVPVGIITKLCRMPLKIGVTEQELLRRRAAKTLWTYLRFAVVPSDQL